jgi:hypothetical protein
MMAAMAASKTSTLTCRIQPLLKNALRTAAGLEHRSIANMVEVLIREHCARKGISVAEEDVGLSNTEESARRTKRARNVPTKK